MGCWVGRSVTLLVVWSVFDRWTVGLSFGHSSVANIVGGLSSAAIFTTGPVDLGSSCPASLHFLEVIARLS